MRINIEDRIIDCNIQYGKGNKLTINIDQVGFITVKAPNNLSEEAITNAIIKNSKSIIERLDHIANVIEVPKIKSSESLGKFFHLGKEFYLNELIETDGLSEEELQVSLKKFYINSCKKVIGERIKIYQKQLGVKPKAVDIVESRTKWGTCSSDRELTFNYRLVMAPVEVIDYVVVHELCHLTHMNHDRSFWRLVGSVFRDYKKRQEYLMTHGQYMTF